MIEKENELLSKAGYFYENILGAKKALFLDNLSFVISGVLHPSLNICSIYNQIDLNDMEALKKTWLGPMTIMTNIENNFIFSKNFYSLGFIKYGKFPILYKKLEKTDFDWGRNQIKDVKNILVKKVESSKGLNDFANISENVYGLPSSSILSAMKNDIVEKENTSLYVGYYKENPIATLASLSHNEDCFVWNMSIVPEFRSSNIMKKMGYVMFEDNFNKNIFNTYTFTTAVETEGLFKKMGAKQIGDVYLWIRK